MRTSEPCAPFHFVPVSTISFSPCLTIESWLIVPCSVCQCARSPQSFVISICIRISSEVKLKLSEAYLLNVCASPKRERKAFSSKDYPKYHRGLGVNCAQSRDHARLLRVSLTLYLNNRLKSERGKKNLQACQWGDQHAAWDRCVVCYKNCAS